MWSSILQCHKLHGMGSGMSCLSSNFRHLLDLMNHYQKCLFLSTDFKGKSVWTSICNRRCLFVDRTFIGFYGLTGDLKTEKGN